MQKISFWIKASRPQTLIASISPVVLCSVLCLNYNMFSYSIFFSTLFAAILIQIMTNFINDLYDFKKGADRSDRLGPERMVQKGFLKESEVKKAIIITLIGALLIGCYLVFVGGIPILIIGCSSFLFAYLYTATKFSIAYNGLGELFVFIYFGLIASLGTAYLQILRFDYNALLIGIISGCLSTSLLIVNNLRDVKSDTISNKKTLVVIFGENFGKVELFFSLTVPYFVSFFLLQSINKIEIVYNIFPLAFIAVFLLIKSSLDKFFLTKKMLPYLSIYILLFTIILGYTIYDL